MLSSLLYDISLLVIIINVGYIYYFVFFLPKLENIVVYTYIFRVEDS